MFETAYTPVLTFSFGDKKVIMGMVPHRCSPIEIPKFPEPKAAPMVRCTACGKEVSPKVASLCVTNWICHSCRPV